jgi:hypothetical protein
VGSNQPAGARHHPLGGVPIRSGAKLLLALDAIGRDNDHALGKASHHASRCRVQPIHHLGITLLFKSAFNSTMNCKAYRIAGASSQ